MGAELWNETMIERRLIHYSESPLSGVNSVVQTDQFGFKPDGLWVSCEGDDDWESWCREEDFRLDRLSIRTEIILKPDNNILWISDAAGIDDLTRQYHKPGVEQYFLSLKMGWRDIAAQHQGLIISPYQWSCRLGEAGWYYGWDCASGCIWDADAISDVQPLDAAPERKEIESQ